NRQHRDVNIQSIFYYAVFYPAIEILAALSGALIIWVGGGWALRGTVSLGVLVAFLQYSRRFFQPISDLSEKFNIIQAAMAASERIFGLLDTPVEIRDSTATHERNARAAREVARTAWGWGPTQLKQEDAGPPYGIEFDHVWFAYREDEFVLRDVSFS